MHILEIIINMYNTKVYNLVYHMRVSLVSNLLASLLQQFEHKFVADFPNVDQETFIFGNAEGALGARNMKINKNTL